MTHSKVNVSKYELSIKRPRAGVDGVPSEESCEHYHACRLDEPSGSYRASPAQCASGELFDLATGKCRSEDKARCNDSLRRAVRIKLLREASSCAELNDHRLAIAESCSHYDTCQMLNGTMQLVREACPDELAFNYEHQDCRRDDRCHPRQVALTNSILRQANPMANLGECSLFDALDSVRLTVSVDICVFIYL